MCLRSLFIYDVLVPKRNIPSYIFENKMKIKNGVDEHFLWLFSVEISIMNLIASVCIEYIDRTKRESNRTKKRAGYHIQRHAQKRETNKQFHIGSDQAVGFILCFYFGKKKILLFPFFCSFDSLREISDLLIQYVSIIE